MSISALYRHSLTLLLPNHCFLCDEPCSESLCTPCLQALPALTSCCSTCALPLASDGLCGECQRQKPSFDGCICPYSYQEQIPALINQFKHQRHIALGKLLAQTLAVKLRATQAADELASSVLVPVPMHWRGLLSRGFNQAEVIAQELSKRLNLPLARAIRKKANTRHQQNLKRKQRLNNSRNLFVARTETAKKRILLVDDVMTTGATAEAISAVLKQAGAEQVIVVALARTPKNR
ncbi:comF family protein [Alteromonadaceae bacterium Bs31]|nr:comF family protein [Alteromonadaceae bacterium Bs31]